MGDPAEKRAPSATYADLVAAPAHLVAELVDGVLYTSPRPASPHAHAASVLGMDIGSPFQRGRGGPGGWHILYEPELHFGDDVLVPDLAGWRRERMPDLPQVAFFTLPPDWVCEVLSLSTASLDRTRKRPAYAAAGVTWLWLVDPLARMLEVFRLGPQKRWVVEQGFSGDAVVRASPFEAIELELSALWLPEAPERPEGEAP
ncbi:Uma2 family endonuclease [Chondromyces crocatus]|uniref:Putative restriction endonuclease domain-containing protein n=1 Tax=Chondromyces crocatus TaxID=52 RepID=A0A0K1EJT3_CHOCO|nr:Uma2 family endonuclease [Chondromyces crocatus]AKT41115.1 uncharacterized protein CMC5_052760 [Chondromyces crocatus]